MGNKKSPYKKEPISIAPGYTDEDWKNLDDLDNENSSDWCEAIKILDARIRDRYLDPVDELIELDKRRVNKKVPRFGFTILAIDCLLIETLQAFIDGETNTRNKEPRMFIDFLTGRPSFKKHFKDKKLACRFYKDVRCGILHQAETRSGWLVRSNGPLLNPKNIERRIINRTEFHKALKSEFESYLTELRDTNNAKLRQNFRKKMDCVVEVSQYKGKCK